MRKLLLSTTALLGLGVAASPANALLVVSFHDVATNTTVSCSDGAACDNGGQANQVVQFNQIVGNFQIVGTFASSDSNTLQASNLAIINFGAIGTNDTLQMLVGQTSFAFPVGSINEAASITFNNNLGAGASTLAFYADAANAQPSFAAPGTVSHVPISSADAQSGVNVSPFFANAPFAMAEFAELNVNGGANITGFSMTMKRAGRRGAGAGDVGDDDPWLLRDQLHGHAQAS